MTPTTDNRTVLLLGSNQGDRHALLAQARTLVAERIGPVLAASTPLTTAPWGDFGNEQPQPFLNQALLVATPLDAHEVLRRALAIETLLGRRRTAVPHYSSRPIDIDIIFFNHDVISTPDLTVPHPRMHLRRFVVEPVAEILPGYRHPLLGCTMARLLDLLPPSP